uniref:Hexamerin 1 n=1 Tax=Perla marginata TaxID=227363 RepID=A4Q991_PERMR|nr:hexamerin 1 [Perla marginata]
MKSAFVLLALAAFAAASVLPGDTTDHKRVADKEFLVKQKNLLQLFVRPHQYNLYKEQAEIGKGYSLESHLADYTNAKAVKQFLHVYKQGMLPKGEIFSVFYQEYLEQAIHLFDVFYFAKDWDTFYKTACWARDRVNEGQFIYALSVAALQREDCKDFVLPPVYEVYPHLFLQNEVIQKAYEVRMQGEHYTAVDTVYKEGETYYIPANYSGWYYTQYPEQFISYFTEDVGVNAFHAYWHMDYPFWANSKYYNVKFDRRGELFYYTQHQLMARYYLERLSNGLKEIKPFSYFETQSHIPGYEPSLRYPNGKEFPMRPEGVSILNNYHVEEVFALERRIHDAIDLGFVFGKDGQKISLKEKEGISILGDMIEGTEDSTNKQFYGSLYNMLRTVYGHYADPMYQYEVAPSVLEHFTTALRDPAYYTLYKRIDTLFKEYKKLMPEYTYDELTYPGVKVESVEIEKLVTYFDNFDIDLDNAVDVGVIEDGQKVNIQARQMRLNHKPYTYKVKVVSDKAATSMVRVFLGPKYDFYGNEYTLDKMREYMVELDRFTFKMTSGENVIERNSYDSSVTVADKTAYRQLFKKVDKAIAGEEQFFVDETERHCGWPQRLLLPKGKKGGMTFRFFVMVTPFDETSVTDMKHLDFTSMPYCGVGKHGVYPDSYSMGYPFDRTIEHYDFFYNAPNMHFDDVIIFHKTAEELNIKVHH